uniref:hypothetical protein n=1 Tax=Microbispora cellulosiformans TaxID=2614688 RepID=UPI00177C207F|nr:hypothetical protein [Microbispora cellulosiformans]
MVHPEDVGVDGGEEDTAWGVPRRARWPVPVPGWLTIVIDLPTQGVDGLTPADPREGT